MHIRQRIITYVLIFTLILPMGIVCSGETYWDVQPDYNAALESGDPEEIISCVKRIEAVYSDPQTEEAYLRLATPCERAAAEYEKLTLYREAAEYYEKSYRYYEWLDRSGYQFDDKLRCLSAMIGHLTDESFTVYTEASKPLTDVFFGAINEPVNGTYFGSCDTHPGAASGQLIYVHYFNENIYDFNRLLPDSTSSSLVEIAWNLPNESYQNLIDVCKEENWEYLTRNIDWMAEQDYQFLLRFGAEVNCWPSLGSETKEAFTEAFKQAFIKVADYVHQAAPNVAMVYSPNTISHWDYSVTDFYPGDEYVDWVGMSAYNNYENTISNGIGSQTDAWYANGVYENQIQRIRYIVEEFGDRKPIVISECGFCYQSTGSTQTMEHAISSLRYFYTYVNMVFPQVKAVFYFNTNFSGNHYSLSEEEIQKVYLESVGANVAMQATVGGEKKYYVPLDNFDEIAEQLTISSYAYYPGSNATVSYEVDGETLFTGEEYPYRFTLPQLTNGIHVLKATAVFGNTTEIRTYGIYVDADGSISTLVSAMKDLDSERWYYEPIAYVMHHKLFTGMTADTFAPNKPLTRGMLVTVLYRMQNQPDVTGLKTPFIDVATDRYYSAPISWAYENQIVNGVSETSFKPDTAVSREQIAAILYRYATFLGQDNTMRESIENRPDTSEIHSYAMESVSWAIACKIIEGDQTGKISPRNAATRAHMAKMLTTFRRYYNLSDSQTN